MTADDCALIDLVVHVWLPHDGSIVWAGQDLVEHVASNGLSVRVLHRGPRRECLVARRALGDSCLLVVGREASDQIDRDYGAAFARHVRDILWPQ